MRSIQNQSAWCARAQKTTTIVMAVLVVGFVALAWWPSQRRQQRLRADVAAMSRKLEVNQAQAVSLPILARDVAQLEARLAKFNKKLPKTAELGEFIRDLTQAGQQYSIRKLVHQPGQVKRQELYSEIPITMNFEGDFNNVFTFVRQLEEMQRLIRVKALNVRLKDGKQGVVDVSLAVNIYYSEL